jgi:endonuclease/exonuclease/phosphatase family metal-dependent hydrolase
MRKIVFLLLSTFCFISKMYTQNITVATYNIRYENQVDSSNGNGWKQRCPVITQLIRFHDFDIFGAQEVLHGQLVDMLDRLTGYGYVGVGRDDGINAGEFAPIFYKKDKLQLLQSGHFWLSEIDDKPNVGWDAALPRICTWGKFQLKENGDSFWFFTLHMDHIGVKARLESSKLVLQKIKTMCAGEPVILTGDFNMDQTSDGYKILISSGLLEDSYETAEIRYALNGTFNDFNPNLKTNGRIDHIFVHKGFRVLRYGVLTDSYRSEHVGNPDENISTRFSKEVLLRLPSDHYPVKVELKLVH